MPYKTKERHMEFWRQWRKTAGGVWNGITARRSKNRSSRSEMKMTRAEFVNWYNLQDRQCHYCGVGEADLSKYRVKPTSRFSIDRLDNEKPYTVSNIVLACVRCNMVKGYTFSPSEMKEIATKYLIGRL